MHIAHKLSLDLMEKAAPARIQVKQGDTLSRSLEISLFAGGESWPIPPGVVPQIRWAVSDPVTGETASGIYDTLPGGSPAWNYAENQLDLIPVPQMFALPGLVRCDVMLTQGDKTLATFDFEIYVNRVATAGSKTQVQDWYKLSSLEQINSAIDALQQWQAMMDEQFAYLEHEVFGLKRILEDM